MARKILIVFLVILPLFLCWVTTMAVPAYNIDPNGPPGINIPAKPDDPTANPVTFILLGTGLVNLAIWGRNRFRKGERNPGESG